MADVIPFPAPKPVPQDIGVDEWFNALIGSSDHIWTVVDHQGTVCVARGWFEMVDALHEASGVGYGSFRLSCEAAEQSRWRLDPGRSARLLFAGIAVELVVGC